MIWIYSLLIIIGFFPLFVVLYKVTKMKRWRKNAVATKATVVRIPLGFKNRLTAITIQYSVWETQQVFEKTITTAGNPYTIGQQLPILYKKKQPADSIVDSGKSYSWVLIFSAFLALFFLVATYMIHQWIAEGVM